MDERTVDERVRDLLAKMTLEEMIMQTDQYYSFDFTRRGGDGRVLSVDMDRLDEMLRGHSCGSIQARYMTVEQVNQIQRYALEKTRLGIPFLFSEEALHGLHHPSATVFPQQIGLAATFDPDLGEEMGRAIGTETRAMGIHETYSPVMDLIRDPRYGRCEESYGEDTCLCASFARRVVTGMQGRNLADPDAIAAEPKHYAGYGSPVAGLNCAPSAMGRHEVFSEVLPVFEAAVRDAGAVDVMCSYNSIDDVPVASDHELLTEVLRDQWGMRGFVRSDLTAVARLHDQHYVAGSRLEAMAMGLEAGVDLQLYDFTHEEWQQGLKKLVETGRLQEEVIRRACGRVLKVKFLLGLFDHPYTDGKRQDRVNCPEHRFLARRIARESITLLKNDGILPLKDTVKTLAVLGPSSRRAMLGDYTPEGKQGVSVLEGIRTLRKDLRILDDGGCHFLGDDVHPFPSRMLRDENGAPGLTGYYFNGPEPKGEPVLVRHDADIHFNWIMSKPCAEVDGGCFSVLWKGSLVPGESFRGWIGFNTQDSMRLYVDGALILDGWGEKDAGRSVPFDFEKGRTYDLRIEFTNDQRGARVVFGYAEEREDFSGALELARQADAVLVCLGDCEDTCGENLDRMSLDLPGRQEEFLEAVCAVGKPVILLLQTGRPVSVRWADAHVPAILEAWFPGEEGGHAVAEVLFGQVNPSGHLPVTFPRHVGQVPCHYSRKPGGGRRYVEMDWRPLYPFGYGLSYTEFAFGPMELSEQRIACGEAVTVSFDVTNTGGCDGTAVPQLYLRDVCASSVKPEMALCAFSRVFLKVGETRRVSLRIDPGAMRTLSPSFRWRIEPGVFRVYLAMHAEKICHEAAFCVEA